MGLAASQARLLLLTGRKDDIEGQMMSIANEKLSLSRQSAELSSEYTDALNAVKLTWKTGSADVDLSYGLLMNPSIANSSQYLLTDSYGKTVLNDRYYNALGLTGNSGSNAGEITPQQFLANIMGISEEDAERLYTATPVVAPDPGPDPKPAVNQFTISYNNAEVCSDISPATVNGNTMLASDEHDQWFGGTDSGVSDDTIRTNFKAKVLDSFAKSIGTRLKTSIKDSLGVDVSGLDGKLDDALDYAYIETLNKFVYNVDNKGDKEIIGNASCTKDGSCNNKNRINYYKDNWVTDLGTHYHSKTEVTVDNSQVIDTFLNYFDKYCQEHFGGSASTSNTTSGNTTVRTGNSGGTGDKTALIGGGNSTDGNNGGGTTVIPDDDVNGNGLSDTYEAGFYLNLYNAINSSGWQLSNDTDNKDYIQTQVLNGNIIIKQFKNGNWATMSSSDPNSPLDTTTDNEAITKAEADYNASKDQLDYKESRLDLKMKDLDTERSAITTETESVAAILKKNIEAFKMFQA